MPNSASIFNPKDNSLEERIIAFKSVLHANNNIELSLKYNNDKQWSDRLGTTEEIKLAQKINEQSLKQAFKSLNYADLQEAKSLGLLTQDEAKQVKTLKAKSELNQLSSSHKGKTHDGHNNKRS
ncbi:hypothetical protein KO527_10815 [Pseudoalteromonas sp. C2R02]|uniref:hypothetical protein n=1 Tax=Pseudoalteromonas sp. C2R02 TaxID=2841565 RepID=UPI001C0961C9|nr:hypothetical protein [Pseudoalteromonas sp. C2R02]MBU2969838.1 hypothetical protein [Pseudoalteromonas sp. C2R02]